MNRWMSHFLSEKSSFSLPFQWMRIFSSFNEWKNWEENSWRNFFQKKLRCSMKGWLWRETWMKGEEMWSKERAWVRKHKFCWSKEWRRETSFVERRFLLLSNFIAHFSTRSSNSSPSSSFFAPTFKHYYLQRNRFFSLPLVFLSLSLPLSSTGKIYLDFFFCFSHLFLTFLFA